MHAAVQLLRPTAQGWPWDRLTRITSRINEVEQCVDTSIAEKQNKPLMLGRVMTVDDLILTTLKTCSLATKIQKSRLRRGRDPSYRRHGDRRIRKGIRVRLSLQATQKHSHDRACPTKEPPERRSSAHPQEEHSGSGQPYIFSSFVHPPASTPKLEISRLDTRS